MTTSEHLTESIDELQLASIALKAVHLACKDDDETRMFICLAAFHSHSESVHEHLEIAMANLSRPSLCPDSPNDTIDSRVGGHPT